MFPVAVSWLGYLGQASVRWHLSWEPNVEKEAAMQKSEEREIQAKAQHVQRPWDWKEFVILKDKKVTMAGASEVKWKMVGGEVREGARS